MGWLLPNSLDVERLCIDFTHFHVARSARTHSAGSIQKLELQRAALTISGNDTNGDKRQQETAEASFRPILKIATRDLGEAVEVRIRDNGIGIAADIKDKLFQPFFTTKPTGEGTGLGLSISYDIVTQQHGGTIEVDSRVGEFTEFIVRLPRAYRATAVEAAS